jgi:flagellar hook-length control protein FliK
MSNAATNSADSTNIVPIYRKNIEATVSRNAFDRTSDRETGSAASTASFGNVLQQKMQPKESQKTSQNPQSSDQIAQKNDDPNAQNDNTLNNITPSDTAPTVLDPTQQLLATILQQQNIALNPTSTTSPERVNDATSGQLTTLLTASTTLSNEVANPKTASNASFNALMQGLTENSNTSDLPSDITSTISTALAVNGSDDAISRSLNMGFNTLGLDPSNQLDDLLMQSKLESKLHTAEIASATNNNAIAMTTQAVMNPAINPQAFNTTQGLSANALQDQLTTALNAPHFGNALQDKLKQYALNNIQEITLKVNPEQMGPIEIKLHLNQQQVSVAMVVQQTDTRQLVEQSLMNLREIMAQAGLQLNETWVGPQFNQHNQQQSASQQQTPQGNGAHSSAIERSTQGMIQTAESESISSHSSSASTANTISVYI